MDQRPFCDFALALKKIDIAYPTNLELGINENNRQYVQNTSVKLIQLENGIEELRNYYTRK